MVRLWALVGVAAILLTAVDADARRKRRRGRRGGLALTCSVDGAKVVLNGKALGKTPLKQQAIPPGTHALAVKKLGYLDFTETIQIKAGKTVRVYADLLPFAGVIEVTANVPNAKVAVDGKLVGKAPLEREVKLGSRTVTVTAPGYAPYTETISADPGNLYAIDVKLGKQGASGAALELATGGDDLALEPLAADDDLGLAPLPGLTGIAEEQPSGDGDGLELTALTPLPGIGGAPSGAAAVDPTLGGDPELAATVEPAEPWYLEWWAITGAAAVVVTGVVVTTVLLTGGDDGSEEVPWEATWRPGDSFSNWALTLGH